MPSSYPLLQNLLWGKNSHITRMCLILVWVLIDLAFRNVKNSICTVLDCLADHREIREAIHLGIISLFIFKHLKQ